MAKRGKTAAPESDGGMSGVRAVDRAIAILQCFSADQPSMSVIEIQKRVGLSRPTLYRLLHTLSTRGLIHAEGDPQRFKLAHGVMKLSHVWLSGLDVVNVARPILEELRDATGETSALFRLEEDRSICILECESRHVLTISRGIGSSMKIPQGATGKALLAFMPQERQAKFLAAMPKDVQRSNLEEALRSAAHNGYTISRGEIFVGAVAVAAPYFDHRGSVVGSVGLYGPAARVSEEKIVEFARLVREAGHRISTLLGFQASAPPARDASAPPARDKDLKPAGVTPPKRSRRAVKA